MILKFSYLRGALVVFLVLLALSVVWVRRAPAVVLVPTPQAQPVQPILPKTTAACPVYSFDDSDNMSGVSTNMIEYFEGVVPSLYVPAEMSGPTIGVGLDLGAAGGENIRTILSGLVSPEDLKEMLTAHGLRGAQARRWVAQHKHLVLDSCVLHAVVQRQSRQYWRHIVKVRPWLATAPSEVKTVMLSFCMHRGTLEPLSRELDARDWSALADKIESFHDSSKSDAAASWQRRRRLEARLIRLIGTKPTFDPD